jgi:hypothetical protein
MVLYGTDNVPIDNGACAEQSRCVLEVCATKILECGSLTRVSESPQTVFHMSDPSPS